jgi:hypothetical protein
MADQRHCGDPVLRLHQLGQNREEQHEDANT